MKNKALLIFSLLLFMFPIGKAQTNLIENWDGNGDNSQTTSFPSTYGWELTPGDFNYANSNSGVRYTDVTSGHTLEAQTYSGRLLMVRWDGSGATTLNSVYSYPVILEANKKYAFSWIYEWWNNASSPILSLGLSTDKEGTNIIATKDFSCAARNVLLKGEMSFYITSQQTYYLTIKANNQAALCAIGELSLIETPATLECTSSDVELNYYESETSLNILPNGSSDEILISAPAGIQLSSTTLEFSGGTVVVSSADSSSVSGDITIQQGGDKITIPVKASFPNDFFRLSKIDTLNKDGAWCWFNDPRAIYYKGVKEQTYFSWVNSVGDILIASYNHETGVYTEKVLFDKFEVDDHDNPAIFFRKDGRIIVYFSKHTSAPAHRFISNNPEDITSWSTDYRFGEKVTYPYPFQIDNKIYVFYRGINWHPTVAISADDGETLGTPQQFITGGGARPYARYCQDNTGAVHIAFTTAHPRNDANNKIYYACFKNGNFYKADGTFIKTYSGTASALNIDKNEAEIVYNANNGKGWIWDITVDSTNQPVMVFASFPDDTDHRYHYARWDGSTWFQKEISKGGKWFPQTVKGGFEPEPNYSGGISLDYNDPSTVFLSKQVKGVFEIFKYTTSDKGNTWNEQALTWNTPSNLINVRPIVPRNHKKGYFDLLWMRGTYVHYTNYHTSIVFQMDSTVSDLDSIKFSKEVMEIKAGIDQQLDVKFYPFIISDKSLSWASSDETIVSVVNGKISGLRAGSASITARAMDGSSASILVTVTEPGFITDALFDFGTQTSPILGGAIQVTESTLLEDSYGWLSAPASRDRGASTSDALRDFHLSSTDKVFKVLVKPGKYHIVCKQGDLSYAHDNMNIYVNDDLKVSGVSCSTGSFTTSEFDVETTKSYLEFKFSDAGGSDVNWVLNSLQIEAISITSIQSNSVQISSITNADLRVYDIVGRLLINERLSGRNFRQAIEGQLQKNKIYLVQLKTVDGFKSIKHYHIED